MGEDVDKALALASHPVGEGCVFDTWCIWACVRIIAGGGLSEMGQRQWVGLDSGHIGW